MALTRTVATSFGVAQSLKCVLVASSLAQSARHRACLWHSSSHEPGGQEGGAEGGLSKAAQSKAVVAPDAVVVAALRFSKPRPRILAFRASYPVHSSLHSAVDKRHVLGWRDVCDNIVAISDVA